MNRTYKEKGEKMISDSLRTRRSFYQIDKNIPLSYEEVSYLIEDITELVPDAFNMKSSRVVLAFGDRHNALWDQIYTCFDGKVSREKIDSFKAGAGTILYFIDQEIVDGMKKEYPLYADQFDSWSEQASGMLQINIWTALTEEGFGANIQHYNPVIDEKVKELFDLPKNYKLMAQMPFGGILEKPDPKEKEDISKRVKIFK